MRKLSDVVWLAVFSVVAAVGALVAAGLEQSWTLGLGLVSVSMAILATNER
jgi:hypothetical protein